MDEFTVVRLSDMGDRMDPRFHLALSKVRGRANELRRAVTTDEVVSKLASLPLSAKAGVLVLARGGTTTVSSRAVDKVVKEYPYLSLAIVEKGLADSVAVIEGRIAADQSAVDNLLALGRELVPTDGVDETSAPRI